jgi:SecD/SecF fusion protein
MQNFVWKLVLIAVVIGVSVLGVTTLPVRYGKDLRGGVSLVYRVKIEKDDPDPQGTLTRVIEVLKDRLDPKGVLDFSMQPLGRDRIEIVMALPDKRVQEAVRTFEKALRDLVAASEIRAYELDDALRRRAAAAEIGGAPGTSRSDQIAALQAAYDRQTTAREALAAAQAAGASDTEVLRLAGEAAVAENDFDDQYDKVLAASLSESKIRRTLTLPTTEQRRLDERKQPVLDEKGEPVMDPSQRDVALTEMKETFGHLQREIDAVVVAHDAYTSMRRGLDDPQDLMRLLRGAGVLEFRVAVTNSQPGPADVAKLRRELEERGPTGTQDPFARWFPLNKLDQWYESPQEREQLELNPEAYFARRDLVAAGFEGQYYLLLYDTPDKAMTHAPGRDWSVTSTGRTVDNLGRPAVSFALDSSGAALMGRLTAAHLQQPMAILLDGQVYSAPNIQGQISSNGIIMGRFTEPELAYLTRVLAAGQLQASLSQDPIAVNTLGPSLGADNLARGRQAFIISLVAVAIFMIAYYFFAGVVAVIAVALNGLIIFAVMMFIDATFTLLGLAGIVLTIGMAVDANVLIYERIREELVNAGLDLKSAVREGYSKALSAIIDGNLTNLLVCLVLFKTATTEVKGFAYTFTIGVCTTLFTALFVTRQIYVLYVDVFKAKSLPMLPIVVPAIHRALQPKVRWIAKQRIFAAVSAVAIIASIILVWTRGADMFDTEFRGGVSLTMVTAPRDPDAAPAPGEEPPRLMLRQSGSPDSVEERIHAIGEKAEAAIARGGLAEPEATRNLVLRELQNASVLTAGEIEKDPAGGHLLASAFQVKVASPPGIEDEDTTTDTIVNAIVDEFGDQLDATKPLEFAGAGADDYGPYVRPIEEPELGKNIDEPTATQQVAAYLGGAAIHLRDVVPPVTPADVAKRIERLRNQPDFVKLAGRSVEVYGLERSAADASRFTDLCIVVYDEDRDASKVEPGLWHDDVAAAEWKLVNAALRTPTSLEQVSSFSSAVAETLAANAVVAVVLSFLGILAYIWVRFGSLRYSVASVVALIHDVIISLGLLALSGYIGKTALGQMLGIEPFRIDLGVVAAILTIIGYSLNDTIVIMDRIRELRGKTVIPTEEMVDRAINQTFSRTVLTSGTVVVAVLVMYVMGGTGIRPFAFCMLGGLFSGTYSTVAIAAPLVYRRTRGASPAATPAPPALAAKADEHPVVAR